MKHELYRGHHIVLMPSGKYLVCDGRPRGYLGEFFASENARYAIDELVAALAYPGDADCDYDCAVCDCHTGKCEC